MSINDLVEIMGGGVAAGIATWFAVRRLRWLNSRPATAKWLAVVLIFAWLVLFNTLTVRRQAAFNPSTYDPSIPDPAFSNSVQGQSLQNRTAADLPNIPRKPIGATFGDQLTLVEYAPSNRQIKAGESVQLSFYWRAERKPDADYSFFVHLVDVNGVVWSQLDNYPMRENQPTSGWEPGELLRADWPVEVDPRVPQGEYRVKVGLYDLKTMRRLGITGSGLEVDGNALSLQGVYVTDVTAPEASCAQLRETLGPSVPWRFRTDPDNIGLKNGWYATSFGDEGWEASSPGRKWQPEYVGAAWYRATYTPLAEWGTAYLSLREIDDTAQLWINGIKQDWDSETGTGDTIVQLPAGLPVQVALRVLNLGDAGGIMQPVRVGRNPWSVLPPGNYVQWLAAKKPDWPMPGWARGGHYAWTFTGLPGAENRSLMGADGAVAPWPTGANVSLWIFDKDSRSLLPPKPVFSLLDNSLPIPQAEWTAAGLSINTTLFRTANGGATRWLATVSNQTNRIRSGTIMAVVRPLGFNPGLNPTFAASFDEQSRLWLDGQPFMDALPRPSQTGVGSLSDLMESATTGTLPESQNLVCTPMGDASAGAAFPISLQPGESFKLSLNFPPEPGAPFPTRSSQDEIEDAREAWQGAIGIENILVPDQRIVDAYRASNSYLLLALSPNGPRPGPLEHAKMWVRDAAYIGEALLSLGQAAWVEEYLPKIFEHQAGDGQIPPIVASSGPEPVQEWDSQGQAAFLVAALYRYQRDAAILRRWEPNVKRSAEFLRSLREQTKADPPATRGLLPPSRSAEDLGPETWHHYWDDFWAVAGLEEAAFIESELGNSEDASWMRAEAQELRESIRVSVKSVMGEDPAYIPGAPEDLGSSAMARGTSVSLYPVDVFPWDDPLIVRSFNTYYSKWIAPSGGGYVHLWGQLWPYGGLGLARDYLRLHRQDIVQEILSWTLDHQTLPGTYAWAEQVNPSTGGISGGDMPHAWAAATYISLVREMLVMRHGDSLELFSGVPASWLTTGKVVGARSAPTEFGSLTALVESNMDTSGPAWKGTLTLTISGSAQPPGGFTWNLLQSPQWIEGPPGVEVRDGQLRVPASGGIVKLGY